MQGPILIMAGGTGGHVFPALALARALQERSFEVVWLGTRRGIESRLVPAAGIPVEWVSIGGLRGKGIATLLLAPFRLLRALWESLAVMRRRRPLVVVGLGGFVSGPGGLAAWLARRPLVIHEQNAVAGLTNRLLARFAREVLVAFPGAFAGQRATREIGNPVRREFFALPSPELRYAGRSGPLRLLVVGGSQGAARLNTIVPQALARLAPHLPVEVRHQAGERWLEPARTAYATARVAAEVVPFIDDIATAYAWADLVVCRAGALTISELAAAGVPAVLVPFPAAVDDHQTRNAGFLVAQGAAVLLPERELTPERLAAEIAALDTARLQDMAGRARALARPHATAELVDATLAAAGVA
ncbi:MAG: undecaprenyldiphospho-muramoylpentapeptide beta-N-acetylglucosaminyltransferase [Steroidobacteraceae bacterium]|nr:undecaprenyldiphospho-muramoylpentapeptide beta-N-acetylglucosaminyltransferase [Nevskiaceae bacterium]MCP5360852.1 undecaprenyldiphospho-muramoylpentapeptide beta-N-acetylglucosaminyltransferase [Nevskiaceae bacterium]MCP5466313.1 undecaprenyldiphospho-muramoylpentapeptide beta-N-acetylglucosaminyltransferase [Nevskiaceae bacterium]